MIPLTVFILLIIAIAGVILIRGFTYENRLFILIPSGMVWGICIYIFLLNFNAKFLPGRNGIILSTSCLILLAFFTYIFIKPKKIKFPNLINFLILSSLVLVVVYFARLKMTSVFPVADSDMQWAYASSFARGNYPIKAPWQPDLNPMYHLGAYFLEGAILSLSNLPLITIHSILNTYFLIAGSLFIIFLLWEDKYSFKNLWLILSSTVLFISYGVIMFVFPSGNFFNKISLQEFLLSFTEYPTTFFAKGISGASLVDLNALSYLPARSLSLGLAILALYFTFTHFKSIKIKISFFVILFSVIALVEESMFLPILMVAGGILLLSFIPYFTIFSDLSKERGTILKVLILTFAIIFLQGGFFSDLAKSQSSFHLNLPFSNVFSSQLQVLTRDILYPSNQFIWFLPSPLWIILILLTFSFISKNRLLGLLGLYSLMAFICFLLIEYIYYPSNNIRFYNFGYISAGVGLFYLFFTVLKSQSYKRNFIALIFIVPLLVPTLLPELLDQYHQIKEARLKNIRSQLLITSSHNTPFEQISDWANKNLPLNVRLISIDTSLPRILRSLQFEYKGIYTVLGPQYIRVLRQEPGPEYYDLVLTLNPFLLKQTKAEYVYIESESVVYQNLPQFRKNDLNNAKYFQVLKSIEIKKSSGTNIFYRLYKILPAFLDLNNGGKNISDGKLDTLQKLIPENKSVYIADYGDDDSKLPFSYRMVLILALKEKDIRRNLSQTDYMVIETSIPYKNGSYDGIYDYYILAPNQKPPISSKLVWSNIFASAWKVY